MITLNNITCVLPDRKELFTHIDLSVNKSEKIALVGNNGSGKSTLLKIIAGQQVYSDGQLSVAAVPYLIPQLVGQYDHLTIAEVFGISGKMKALQAILQGDTAEINFETLANDWTVEERSVAALEQWGIAHLDLHQQLCTLSGGQKTRVFLAGIYFHEPDLILMDEPSNHLDAPARSLLYRFIESTTSTLIVVSHDRQLLSLLPKVCELTPRGIKVYGGNYDHYIAQKAIEENALHENILDKEKELRKAKQKERQIVERQLKLDARGKGKQQKAGVARIMMNTLRNNAENSTAHLKRAHANKIEGIHHHLQDLRAHVPSISKVKLAFGDSGVHRGKILCTAVDINCIYSTTPLWKDNLSFQIISGDRIVVKGPNGSGKTTLLKIITGKQEPSTGQFSRAACKTLYIDQDYSLLHSRLTIYEQAQAFNTSGLLEHEIKIRLNRFSFTNADWEKPCHALSGGERMKLMLCCLTIDAKPPDIILLDEPTNNLDLQNIAILTAAINEYQGTLIVVSHDEIFVEQTGIDKAILLEVSKGGLA